MPSFRNDQPQRRLNRRSCKNYKSYHKTLREDFNQRCGYCNDYDKFRIRNFTLDHFLPQDPTGWSHSRKQNDYYNLVYACMHCNLAKSNKWPTKDPTLPNDGQVGFMDPELAAYADLFERNDAGEISACTNNALAAHIREELKLWLPAHAKMWRFEKLKRCEEQLQALPTSSITQEIKQELSDLAYAISALISDIFADNE